MKKKIYGMLVVLSCPIILNTQQVFAEELPTNDAAASAVVEEIMAEALMTVPEAVTESFTEPVTEESTEATEESTTVDSSTEVTEETTTSETPVTEENSTEATEETTEESSTDDSVELTEGTEELPVEDVVAEEEVTADTLTAEDETEAATSRAAIVSTTIKLTVNGAVIHEEIFSGLEGDIYSYLLRDYSNYTVHSISDVRFGVRQTGDFPTLYIPLVSDAPEVIVELVPNTTVGVFFNLTSTYGRVISSEHGDHPVQVIYQENGETTYSYVPPVLEFYDYTGPEVITGTFDSSGMVTVEVPYYVRKQYSLTVEYIDELGNHIDTEVFNDAIWGYDYLFTPKPFPGRTLISIDGLPITLPWQLPYEIFDFPRANSSLTVVYSSIIDAPFDDSFIPGTQESGAVLEQVGQENLVPLKTIQPIENKKVTLPETGEEMNTLAVAAGTALFLQASYMMLKKKKESEG